MVDSTVLYSPKARQSPIESEVIHRKGCEGDACGECPSCCVELDLDRMGIDTRVLSSFLCNELYTTDGGETTDLHG